MIGAITEDDLPTAVSPFMFGGKVVHELYFDHSKLVFFTKPERIGVIASALIIASLAAKSEGNVNGKLPLSDQLIAEHPELIVRRARNWKYGREVSTFLTRLNELEDEWRQPT